MYLITYICALLATALAVQAAPAAQAAQVEFWGVQFSSVSRLPLDPIGVSYNTRITECDPRDRKNVRLGDDGFEITCENRNIKITFTSRLPNLPYYKSMSIQVGNEIATVEDPQYKSIRASIRNRIATIYLQVGSKKVNLQPANLSSQNANRVNQGPGVI